MRILSWNIQWGRGIDGRVDLARTAAVIRQHQPDIVCLQEVAVNHPGLPGGADGDQPARLAAWFPDWESVYGAASDLPDGHGGRRQFGQALFSRWPILQVFRHLLPFPSEPALPAMPRLALEAAIDTPQGPLRIVTTHLEYYSIRQRMAQVDCLRELQMLGHRHAVAPRSAAETDPPFAVLPRGEQAVLCGDFNFPSGAAEYARLRETLAVDVPPLVDAWAIAHPAVPPAPTFGVHDASFSTVPGMYDFFFVSGNLASCVDNVTVDAETTASDHQPILLDLV
jgi:endonuclease/exonuclease/phosphatase family metal-dependent hydrolase